MRRVVLLAASATAYKVEVIDRCVTGKPLITGSSIPGYPYVLNPAWLPLPGGGGGLFLRASAPSSQPNYIAFVTSRDGKAFSPVDNTTILLDGPPDDRAARAMDPRAITRPSTGDYYVNYQIAHWKVEGKRQTIISSSRTPHDLSSWKRFAAPMFPTRSDCGTALRFKDDTSSTAGTAYAVATLDCELRGGNLTLVSSTDGLRTWKEEQRLLDTRAMDWDNATLSAATQPVKLSDGSWLLLYNVDNLWPVHDPAPMPAYGRCALGWAILAADTLEVIARADAPLVSASLPWEIEGMTPKVVYTDGIKVEAEENTFTVYAGGADAVVESFTIRVVV